MSKKNLVLRLYLYINIITQLHNKYNVSLLSAHTHTHTHKRKRGIKLNTLTRNYNLLLSRFFFFLQNRYYNRFYLNLIKKKSN